MASDLNRRGGRYWLLYFQPMPEDGERVVIAVIIDDGARVSVHFDSKFAKVRKIYPGADIKTLSFYLDDLQRELERSSDIHLVLASSGPQLVPSGERRVALPISEHFLSLLVKKYAYPPRVRNAKQKSRDALVSKRIEAFVRESVSGVLELKTDVSAKDILGVDIPDIRTIALAVPTTSGWMLGDGVDLNQSSPKHAVNRADAIAKSYWHYARAAGQSNTEIRRVGIVLNGNSHLKPDTNEAHDYIVHRFRSDSDLTVDGASTEVGSKLRVLLSSVM